MMTYAEAFKRLTGREMTAEQVATARGIGNEAQAIDYLERQIKAALAMVSETLGVDVDVSDIAHGFYANDRTFRINPTNMPRFIGGIPPQRIVELARAKYDFIGNLYREQLGREPDDAGAAFWRETWAEQFKAGIR